MSNWWGDKFNPANPLDYLFAAGYAVDTPWAMARNVMAGEDIDKGLFDPQQRATGRDVLENLGVFSENQPGLDAGDVAGFGLEMLDPISWAGGLWAGKAIKGARAARAAKAAEATRPGTALIPLGQRALAPLESTAPALKQVGSQTLPRLAANPTPIKQPALSALPRPYMPPFFSRLQKAAERLPDRPMKIQSLENALRRSPEGLHKEEIEFALQGLTRPGKIALPMPEDVRRAEDLVAGLAAPKKGNKLEQAIAEGRSTMGEYLEQSTKAKPLPGSKKVTREDVLGHINENKVDLQEVAFGEDHRWEWFYDTPAGELVPKGTFGTPQQAMADAAAIGNMPSGPGGPSARKTFRGAENPPRWQRYSVPLATGEDYKELLLYIPERLHKHYDEARDAVTQSIVSKMSKHGIDLNKLNDAQDLVDLGMTPDEARGFIRDWRTSGAASDMRADSIRKSTELGGHYGVDFSRRGEPTFPNPVAHIRFEIVTKKDGRKAIFIHELQGDLHQEAAKRGYSLAENAKLKEKAEAGRAHSKAGIKAAEEAFENKQQEVLDAINSARSDDAKRAIAESFGLSLDDQGKLKRGSHYATRDDLLSQKLYEELSEQQDLALEVANKADETMASALKGPMPDKPFKGNEWARVGMKRIMRYAIDHKIDEIVIDSGELAAEYAAGGQSGYIKEGIEQWYDIKLPAIIDHMIKKHGGKLKTAEIPLKINGGEYRNFISFEIPEKLRAEHLNKGVPLLNILPWLAAGAGAGAAGSALSERPT